MTNFELQAHAPGKILWLGGYAVLDRPNVGFVTTIDQHVHVFVRHNADNMVQISAPQLVQDPVRGTVDRRTGKLDINAPPELKLLKTTIEIAMMYSLAIGYNIGGVDISTLNDPAFSYRISGNGGERRLSKSGMGSSAALTVAAGAGVMELFEDGPFITEVHKIAQLAHAAATGKVGSGFDVAAATYGSVVYRRFSPSLVSQLPGNYSAADVKSVVDRDWDYRVTALQMPTFLHPVIGNLVGNGAVTTAFVKRVNEFKEKDPEAYQQLINEIEANDQRAIAAMERLRGGEDPQHMEILREAFEAGRVATKKLGAVSGVDIEPDDLSELVVRSKAAGAFLAKLPGAGGRDSIAALCRTEGDARRLTETWRKEKDIDVLNVKLQRRGLSVSRSVG